MKVVNYFLEAGRKNLADQGPHLKMKFNLDYFKIDWHIWDKDFWMIEGVELVWFLWWVSKDLCWNQAGPYSNWYYAGWLFGVLSVVWGGVFLTVLVIRRQWTMIYFAIGEELWLLGNWVWMRGEIYDFHTLGDWGDIYDMTTIQAQDFFYSAIGVLAFYYLVLRPIGFFEGLLGFTDQTDEKRAERNHLQLVPRYRWYFRDFTEYWNLHLICWASKDLGWALLSQELWIVGVYGTLMLAADYSKRCVFRRGRFFNTMYFMAHFFWVSANGIWAAGDLFWPDDATIEFDMATTPHSFYDMRWWASWVFLASFTCLATAWTNVLLCHIFGWFLEEPSDDDFIEYSDKPHIFNFAREEI